MKAFMKEKDLVIKELKSDEKEGLTHEGVRISREKFGVNELPKKEQESVLRRIINSAKEPMIIMLIVAGLIALGVNVSRGLTGGEADYLECFGIFMAISLSVIITVIMEGKSAKAFEALSKINNDTLVKVIRNDEVLLIPQVEIVVGDIVVIETGDKLPADGRLISSTSLMVDESALTGESMPVKKNAEIVLDKEKTPVADRINMLYSGGFVTSGNGKMIVTGVGENTEFGKIATELSISEKSTTPLQEKLANLGKFITILGTLAALIVFIVQVIIFIINGTASFETISEAFITSIVLIVAAVPEGLPTIVAVSLSINIIKMSKQNALVKKMIACETIGCINVICSDKTGTLTENKMTVKEIYINGGSFKPNEINSSNVINNFALNSNADLNFDDNESKFIGNPTECALLVALKKSNIDYQKVVKSQIYYTYSLSHQTLKI
ncbi:HAD-IC family P-type ATPase [Clostridium sp. LY3-2]|uniref:HAD-IC family P-type ATPase n=1 Tax=Clostridium sp. LY3-2 TaxID=2942482 RepID=UPI0027E417E2|nr:HAD-IC family P-type ATPase [Clostridium sp. LY3-2]